LKLESIKTMDGVPLAAGMNVYELYNRGSGRFTVWPSIVQVLQGQGVVNYSRDELMSSFVPIHNGIAIGLWHSREVLEAGLGKGAQ